MPLRLVDHDSLKELYRSALEPIGAGERICTRTASRHSQIIVREMWLGNDALVAYHAPHIRFERSCALEHDPHAKKICVKMR